MLVAARSIPLACEWPSIHVPRRLARALGVALPLGSDLRACLAERPGAMRYRRYEEGARMLSPAILYPPSSEEKFK